VFSKNRDRLLTTDMSRKVMAAILAHREVAPRLSDGQFLVDGTLVKAFATGLGPWRYHGSPSMKSFQPKVGVTPPNDDPGSPARNQPEPTVHGTDPIPRRNRNA
jgi:hypothetical protein